MRNKKIIFAVLFPIILLAAVTINKHIKLTIGDTFVIPIEGFDPRDLLSGHYLIYSINYGKKARCDEKQFEYYNEAFLCLKKVQGEYDSKVVYEEYYASKEAGCEAVIKGTCKRSRFIAGIERFYIPEEHAAILDRVVRDKKGKIIVSITHDGSATVKDLLINDRPWLDYVNDSQRHK